MKTTKRPMFIKQKISLNTITRAYDVYGASTVTKLIRNRLLLVTNLILFVTAKALCHCCYNNNCSHNKRERIILLSPPSIILIGCLNTSPLLPLFFSCFTSIRFDDWGSSPETTYSITVQSVRHYCEWSGYKDLIRSERNKCMSIN